MSASKSFYLNFLSSEPIPNCTKFVAIYADGAGASLFWVDDKGRLLTDHNDYWGASPNECLLDAGYLCWIELPNNFKLWFEQ